MKHTMGNADNYQHSHETLYNVMYIVYWLLVLECLAEFSNVVPVAIKSAGTWNSGVQKLGRRMAAVSEDTREALLTCSSGCQWLSNGKCGLLPQHFHQSIVHHRVNAIAVLLV